jgi:hypothetical protein
MQFSNFNYMCQLLHIYLALYDKIFHNIQDENLYLPKFVFEFSGFAAILLEFCFGKLGNL